MAGETDGTRLSLGILKRGDPISPAERTQRYNVAVGREAGLLAELVGNPSALTVDATSPHMGALPSSIRDIHLRGYPQREKEYGLEPRQKLGLSEGVIRVLATISQVRENRYVRIPDAASSAQVRMLRAAQNEIGAGLPKDLRLPQELAVHPLTREFIWAYLQVNAFGSHKPLPTAEGRFDGSAFLSALENRSVIDHINAYFRDLSTNKNGFAALIEGIIRNFYPAPVFAESVAEPTDEQSGLAGIARRDIK